MLCTYQYVLLCKTYVQLSAVGHSLSILCRLVHCLVFFNRLLMYMSFHCILVWKYLCTRSRVLDRKNSMYTILLHYPTQTPVLHSGSRLDRQWFSFRGYMP